MLSPRLAAALLVALVAIPAIALLGPAPLAVLDPGASPASPRGPVRGDAGAELPVEGLEGMLKQAVVLGEVPDAEDVPPLPEGPSLALAFAPRVEVQPGKAGAEPGIDIDAGDCVYINAIADRSLWRKCPSEATFKRLSPPGFVIQGLDTDVAFDTLGNTWYSDLWLGSASVTASRNAGGTWQTPDFVSLLPPVDDRQWLVHTASPAGGAHMLQVTNQIPTGVTITRCLLATPPDSPVVCAPTGYAVNDVTRFCICPPGQPGASRDGSKVVIPYFAIRNLNPTPGIGQPLLTSDLVIEAAVSLDGGLTWSTKTVATASGDPGIFPVAVYDTAGNAYVAWAADRGANQGWEVWVARSLDGGATWDPVTFKMSAGGTNVMPWIAAGAPGQVALAWYHSDEADHPESVQGQWFLDFAQSSDMNSPAPTVVRARAAPEPVHRDDLSISGLNSDADRDLLDFLQVALDSQGKAHIAYADDLTDGHNGHAHVWYVRQTA